MITVYTTADGKAYTAGDGATIILKDLEALITDRTQTDVDYLRDLQLKGYAAMTDEEKAAWSSGTVKGAYNASDLNRVGVALNYLRSMLADLGYLSPSAFEAKTDWAMTEIPSAVEFFKYLTYVSLIRDATKQFAETPLAPADAGAFNYSGANDIEKILLASEYILENIRASWFFCDDLCCGEV